jgi:peptidylprolyl isomerase
MEITVAGEANGTIRIALRDDLAPAHVERIVTLAERGDYDGVVFHRVLDGFMAQTGDVANGKADGNPRMWGSGGSDLPNLQAEFSAQPFERGVVGMARSQSPHSANSQFFIMFAPAPHLNGQYTVVGQMIDGYEVLDAIKRGTGGNGAVIGAPDRMEQVRISR